MEKTLAQLLSDAKGGPIDFKGKSVEMSYRISVSKAQEIEIEILYYNGEFQQGFEISLDQRKGHIEVDGQKLTTPVFWTNTAPRMFSFKCFPKKTNGIMNVWNVWKNVEYKESIDAWVGNAGLYVERIDDESMIFHCSNGVGNINFEDFVFKIKIKK